MLVDASLAYEILMYFNSFYFGMFAFVELSSVIYKTIMWTPIWPLPWKHLYVYLFATLLVVETSRIYLGRKGSLSKHGWQVIVSVILTLPSMTCIIYLIFFQEYPLRLEIALCALQLILHIVELFYAILFAISSCRPRKYT